MKKLRETIETYPHWRALNDHIDRIEAHVEADFSVSVENAKSLLESIGKEICSQKDVVVEKTMSINMVLKKAFSALGYSAEAMVTQISSAFATIGQKLGELRNEISPTSHGKSMDELRMRNNKVDTLTREFLIDSISVVAVFLIRAFEERSGVNAEITGTNTEKLNIAYSDNEEFNDFWDGLYGEFTMGDDYLYSSSEILFYVDSIAYKNELEMYSISEVEEEEE